VGPRASLDDVKRRKILSLPGLELFDTSIVQPVASRYTDGAIAATTFCRSVTLFKDAVPIRKMFCVEGDVSRFNKWQHSGGAPCNKATHATAVALCTVRDWLCCISVNIHPYRNHRLHRSLCPRTADTTPCNKATHTTAVALCTVRDWLCCISVNIHRTEATGFTGASVSTYCRHNPL
jgi:hypothetical protein